MYLHAVHNVPMARKAVGRPRVRKRRVGRFGQRLRRAREARGLSQEAAAEEIGVAWRTVASWELGEKEPRGPARKWVLGWIARALGESDEQ